MYNYNPKNLEDYTKQDSIILNIQRAVEATIDHCYAYSFIKHQKKLGIPYNIHKVAGMHLKFYSIIIL